MNTLEKLIREDFYPNPFSLRAYGNFWEEKPQFKTVESIHKKEITQIIRQLKQLKQDPFRATRTVLLTGDAGCGKSHLLGRLKNQLNSEAFFAYVFPIQDKEYLWRHTLQYVFESLMHRPEGEQESQLSLWLKGLLASKHKNFLGKILGERWEFINNLTVAYPGIYEPNKFFAILYHLTKEDTYQSACKWLKGFQLNEEELSRLGVNKSIETETEARGILNNFGRISQETKPIVICFDQVERAFADVYDLNTTFHTERLTNFLVIISIVQDNLKSNIANIESDIGRITKTVQLGAISLQQAEELWQSRLAPLHQLCHPQPESLIAPLDLSRLEKEVPGGKINLRAVIKLGFLEYEEYAEGGKIAPPPPPPPVPFITLWKDEFKKTQEKVKNIKQFSEPELLDMLKEIFQAYQVENISSKLLSGKNASFSFSYTCPKTGIKQGLVWQENPNGNAFNALINACKKVFERNQCDSLFLLRNEHLGRAQARGHQLFHRLFKPCSKKYIHLKYSLDDIQYLSTYYKLVKDAYSRELVIDFEEVSVRELQDLVVKHQVLANCELLQKLEIVKEPIPKVKEGGNEETEIIDLPLLPSKEEVFKIVKDNLIIGIPAIHGKLQQEAQYSHVTIQNIKNIVEQIKKKDKSLTILGSGEDAIISYVPKK